MLARVMAWLLDEKHPSLDRIAYWPPFDGAAWKDQFDLITAHGTVNTEISMTRDLSSTTRMLHDNSRRL